MMIQRSVRTMFAQSNTNAHKHIFHIGLTTCINRCLMMCTQLNTIDNGLFWWPNCLRFALCSHKVPILNFTQDLCCMSSLFQSLPVRTPLLAIKGKKKTKSILEKHTKNIKQSFHIPANLLSLELFYFHVTVTLTFYLRLQWTAKTQPGNRPFLSAFWSVGNQTLIVLGCNMYWSFNRLHAAIFDPKSKVKTAIVQNSSNVIPQKNKNPIMWYHPQHYTYVQNNTHNT